MHNEQSVRDSISTYRKMMMKFMTEKNTHVLLNTQTEQLLSKTSEDSELIENALALPEIEAKNMAKTLNGRYQVVSKYVVIDRELKKLYRALTNLKSKETV